MQQQLRFLRNGELVEISDFPPDLNLLEYLRLYERKTGTKEGCNEGDCGACTVSLGKLRNGKLTYEPVNSCILLLGQVAGCDVITVDDLAEGDKLHPVQQSMVDFHGSQCGFCTPGFVMTLFTMHHAGEPVTKSSINDWLAGNLCRCTGYRPIVGAAFDSASAPPRDALMQRWDETEKTLRKLASGPDLFVGNEQSFFAAPASVDSLADLCKKHTDAVILSGATDVGLWINKQLRVLPKLIFVGRAKGFDAIKETKKQVLIGAGATYRTAFETLSSIDPDIKEVLRRLGSRHVRASGTIGGNIANGSPIGDTPPILIALGAELELRFGKSLRQIPLEDFFIDYGKQDRKPGELASKIIIPTLGKNDHFRAFKISKRFDQDISAVLFAAKIAVEKGCISAARIACGGMAGVPKRAMNTEAKLVGVELENRADWEAAIEALSADYTPMSDMRASAKYRLTIVQNLLKKTLIEIRDVDGGAGSNPTRIEGIREAAE